MTTAASPQPTLVGIAKMAAESDLLEAKRQVEYRELETKSWINKCAERPNIPFAWSINPYRGCEYACQYCYARYTHEFMNLSPGADFETKIFAKEWSRSMFVTELRRIPRDEAIGLGTATDPYQPAERRYGLTRRVLECLAEDWGRTLYLTTKSDLVKRDVDLYRAIGQRNRVVINMTITTLDPGLARLIEPRAPRPSLRMDAVAALAKAGVAVGVQASPVLPGINDSHDSLDQIAWAAKEAGARHFIAFPVFLKPCSMGVFLPFLRRNYPHLASRYQAVFEKDAFLRGEYPQTLKARVAGIRARYGLGSREEADQPAWQPQLPLFAA